MIGFFLTVNVGMYTIRYKAYRTWIQKIEILINGCIKLNDGSANGLTVKEFINYLQETMEFI